jgi:hypothetical protein
MRCRDPSNDNDPELHTGWKIAQPKSEDSRFAVWLSSRRFEIDGNADTGTIRREGT